MAIHAVWKTMNVFKISNYPVWIRSINHMYSFLISKNGDKHWSYALKVAPTITSLPKINCTTTTRIQTVNCVDMILICHYWANPFQITWLILTYLDLAPSSPSMKGKIHDSIKTNVVTVAWNSDRHLCLCVCVSIVSSVCRMSLPCQLSLWSH